MDYFLPAAFFGDFLAAFLVAGFLVDLAGVFLVVFLAAAMVRLLPWVSSNEARRSPGTPMRERCVMRSSASRETVRQTDYTIASSFLTRVFNQHACYFVKAS